MTGSHKHGHGHDHRHAHRQSHASERVELTLSTEAGALETIGGTEASPRPKPSKSRSKGTRKKG